MATVQEPTRGAIKHESFVDAEIARASSRIRAHDIGVASLQIILATLVYTLLMVLLDRWLDLPAGVRQVAFVGFLAGLALQAVIVLSRPFRREVNPYFAARQVERAIPAAKNSVVNWLDLRDEPLSPTIKTALGAKAASDLGKADFDEVLRDRRIGWLGGVVAGLAVAGLALLLILRPAQFLSLIGRTFAPFGAAAAIAKQTELSIVQPSDGNATVPVNHSVEFRVRVDGRVPDREADDAVRLQMRYNSADPVWEDRRMEPSARDPREWTVRVPSAAVQNGFFYRMAGGDAETPEYRITVRSSPLIDGFDVVFRYRPYLRFADQAGTNPNLEALRGTQATITVKTNRIVKDGWLRFDKIDGQADVPSIAGEPVPEQPNALRFRFTLERDGKYRVHFKSVEGDENQDPIPYSIKVLTDHAPQVEITRPAPDGLAINGTLSIDGKANDDFGITKMRLCARLLEFDKDTQPLVLADRPFRDGKSFRFDDGTFPRFLEYKEAIPLDQLRGRGGLKPELKAGKIIEYWVEADDNCDYTQSNTGRSKVYRVTLGDPKADDERKTAQEQAKADKQNFDQKQDQDLKNENDGKKNAADKQPQDPADQPPQPGADQQKQDSKQPNQDKQPNEQQGDGNQQPMDPQQKAEEDKAKDLAKKLEEKLRDKQNDANQPKGESKPDQQGGKPDSQPQQDGSKGEPKPDQQNPNQPNAGQKGETKPDQRSEPGDGHKGEAKNEGQPEQAPQPGESKPMKSGSDNKSQQGGGNSDQQKGDQAKPDSNNPAAGKNDQQKYDAGKADANNQAAGKQDQQKGDQAKPDSNNSKAGGQQDQQKGNQPKPDANNQKSGGQPDQQKGDQAKSDANSPGAGVTPDQQKGNQQKPDANNQQGGAQGDQQKGDQQKSDGNQQQGSGKPDQQKGQGGQPNPGEAKPGAKPEAGNPGETKSQPKDGAQPGENKDQPGGKPDAPNPNQKPDGSTQPKPGDQPGANQTSNPQGKPDPNKPDAKSQSQPQKNDSGQGGDAGKNQSTGENTKPGPKENPTQNDPKAKPDANDPGRKGEPGKTPSGQPDSGAPPNDADVRKGEGKGLGKSEPAPSKGEAKPDSKNGKTGSSGEKGDLQDAPKGSQAAGAKPKSEPTSDGTAGGAKEKKDGTGSDQKSADELVKQAADLAKKLAENAKALKDAAKNDPNRSELAKQLSESTGDQEKLAEALRNADPKLKQELADALNKLGQELSKNESGQPMGDPKPSDIVADLAKELGKPGDKSDANAKPGDKDGQKSDPSNVAGGQPGDSTNVKSRSVGDEKRVPTGDMSGDKPNAEHAAKAGEMLLEDFKTKVDRKLLDEMKMTEKEYAEFLRAYESMVKRQKAQAEKNDRERGSASGRSAANTGAKRVQGGNDKPNQLQQGGAVLPPPEMRDGYKGFTEDVSKSGTKPKDK